MIYNAAAPKPGDNMGEPQVRYDARAKVTGAARYASDQAVPHPAYAVLVTSPIALGHLTGIDESAARNVPGVLDIFTHANTNELKQIKYGSSGGGASTSIQDFGPDIRHDGQILAMVVAETFEAAREAAYSLRLSCTAEHASPGFDSEGAKSASAGVAVNTLNLLREWWGTGDAEAALSSSVHRIEQSYGTPTQHHNAIELFTTTCVWDEDRLTIYEPSQFVYGLKNAVAERLDIDPDNIHIVSPYVGGAFGSKAQMTPRTGLVAFAARKLGRPVKLVATRDQGFTIATYRAETRHHVRLAADASGKFVAYTHEGWEVTSRPDAYSVKGTDDTAHLYHFGAVRTHVNVVHADRNTPGFMRSPPVVPYVFALESAIDELAVAMKMDPVELRRRNDGDTDSFGKKWSSRSLMRCYDEAAAAFGWSKRKSEPGSMRDGDWLIGWGCATAVYPTHVAAAAVRIRFDKDDTIVVSTAAHDIGTGAYTVIGQQVAEEFGIAPERVRVELGDSDLPPSPVAGGSTTTASVCSAVVKGANALKVRLLEGLGQQPLLGENGRVVAPGGKNIDVFAAAKSLRMNDVEEYAEYIPPGASASAIDKLRKGTPTFTGGAHGETLMYALGAEFVEVRVHAMTKEVRCTRAVGAFAGGRIANTRTARSQLMGGIIWGISSALHEATEIDEKRARYVNDNLAEYLVPVNADIGDIEVIFVPEVDKAINPAGVKGLGELGNVGTAAAITNAVYHATGVRIRELPVRIEKLLVDRT